MKWNKVGLIFSPDKASETSMFSHAAVPIAEHLKDNIFKIYFSSRDAENKSYVNFIIIDLYDPKNILDTSNEPVLSPGNTGEFDDSGAMGSWIVDNGKENYFYYIGWNLGKTVPFRNSIGLAKSEDKIKYKKMFNGPIIDRSKDEPHFVASSCVIKENDIWRMWYVSCVEWDVQDNRPIHKYHIKYAESDDGINWRRDQRIAIDFENMNEYAISRPSVVKDGNLWRMWYSFRGSHYLIGYAESIDGINWKRLDEHSGINLSKTGWDSQMIEYPYVFKHNEDLFMLYNGNNYGESGFGLAILEQ